MLEKILAKSIIDNSFWFKVKDDVFEIEKSIVEEQVVLNISSFFKTYQRMPSRSELILVCERNLKSEEKKFWSEYKEFIGKVYSQAGEMGGVGEEVLVEVLAEEKKRTKLKRVIQEAGVLVEKSTGEALKFLEKFIFKQEVFKKDRKIVAVEDVDNNFEAMKYRMSERVPTLIKSLDEALYGGLGVRELTCFIAPTGKGKTTFLVNLMYGFLSQGKNCLYLTLEMGIRDILRRLYRRILFASKEEFSEGSDEERLKKWLNKFFGMSGAKGKVVYYPPNSLGVEQVMEEIKRIEFEDDIKIDVLLIDHLDLMTSWTRSIRQKESFSFWRLVVDELRQIALKEGIPVVTATQSNRGSVNKTVITEVDVGESFGKVQSSDVVLTLNQTAEEADFNRIRVVVLKNRDFLRGRSVELYVDFNRMMICDLMFAQASGWLVGDEAEGVD